MKYLGKKQTREYIIKDLRSRGLDINNELSDDFLIDEAYHQFEIDF